MTLPETTYRFFFVIWKSCKGAEGNDVVCQYHSEPLLRPVDALRAIAWKYNQPIFIRDWVEISPIEAKEFIDYCNRWEKPKRSILRLVPKDSDS